MIRWVVAFIGTARPEPDPGDGGVDADHPALGVGQRAAGVAGVERGVGLDDVLDHPRRRAAAGRHAAAERADHAGRHACRPARAGCRPRRRASRPAASRRRRTPAGWAPRGRCGRRPGRRAGRGRRPRSAATVPSANAALPAVALADDVGVGDQVALAGQHHGRPGRLSAARRGCAGPPPAASAVRRRRRRSPSRRPGAPRAHPTLAATGSEGRSPTAQHRAQHWGRPSCLDACMPSALPSGEPAPADGALPDEALAELGRRPFGFYVHVPFCTVRCGYCDFNTYTAEDLGRTADARGASRATYAEAAIDEIRLRPPGSRGRGRPRVDGLLRRRYADAAGAGRAGLGAGRDRGGVRAGARRRGDDRGQPRQRGPLGPRGAAPGRVRPDLLRHAVRRPARAGDPGPHPRPAAGAGRRRLGAVGRLRPGQPGPDLRHAGGVAGRLGGLASTPPWPARPTTSRRTR